MKRVYLIRHGLPDFLPGKHYCLGITDIPLGPEGAKQAAGMAARLPPVSAVFSSPLSRAVDTAKALGQPVTLLPGLREMDAGEWDGLDFDEIRRRYPRLYAARGKDPGLPLPGGEAHNDALVRFRSAMEQAALLAEGDFAVVAHGGVIRLFLESLGAEARKPDYAEIICLRWENGRFFPQSAL